MTSSGDNGAPCSISQVETSAIIRIFVDADACPVKNEVYRVARAVISSRFEW